MMKNIFIPFPITMKVMYNLLDYHKIVNIYIEPIEHISNQFDHIILVVVLNSKVGWGRGRGMAWKPGRQ